MLITPQEALTLVRIVKLSPRMWTRYELLLWKQEELGGFSLPLSEMGALWKLSKTATWHVAKKLRAAGLLRYRNGKYRAV